MKLAVIGATGLVGNAVVKEAAGRGHEVVAFARHIDKVYKDDKVIPEVADVNAPEFAEQLKGFDGVISTFNGGWTNPNSGADTAKGAKSITAAAKKAAVPYILIVGGAGSLYVAPGKQLIDTPDFPEAIYPAANAARNWLNDLKKESGLNWAFISPAAAFASGEISFERTGNYRMGQDDVMYTGDKPADISVADLAVAIVDDVEKRGHLHKRFTVAEAE